MDLPDLRHLTRFDVYLREVPSDFNALTCAIVQAQSDLTIAETEQNHGVIVRLLGYLGNACRIIGRTTESVEYLERAVLQCQTLNDRDANLLIPFV